MFTLIANLFSILRNVPSAISIIKMLIDIVGSDTAKAILETIQTVVKTFQSDTPVDELPPQERKRLIDRIKLRLGKDLLGLSEVQFVQTLASCGRAGELQNA